MNVADISGSLQNMGAVRVYQSGPSYAKEKADNARRPMTFVAKVSKTYTDRMTCDIETSIEKMSNVPVLCKTGINSDNAIWGELDLPQKGDYVLVLPLDNFCQKKVIVGTLTPYLSSLYQDQQTLVNSSNKSFTKKLLEKNINDSVFRKVFKSGTTLEIDDKGTVTLETPSGSFIQINESSSGKLTIEHKAGTKVTKIELDANGGFDLQDSNGNTITSSSTKITLNSHLEISQ